MDEAAKRSNISRATLYNWLKDEAFVRRLREEQEALFREGLSFLKQAVSKAARELIGLLESEDETSKRLAAKEVLSLSLRLAEYQEIDERIARIESYIDKKSGSREGDIP